MTSDPSHLIPLSGKWRLWKIAALRGAGLPVDTAQLLSDRLLAEEVDTFSDEDVDRLKASLARADERQRSAIRKLLDSSRLLEALVWQNPRFAERIMEHDLWSGPRNARRRANERTLVSYVQRYARKNDTIGFFGPVGWATVTTEAKTSQFLPGPHLTNRHSVYFEVWAIDAVAAAFADRPGNSDWVTPRRLRTVSVPSNLGDIEKLLLQQCDGQNTKTAALDAAGLSSAEAYIFDTLETIGLISCRPELAMSAHPEMELLARLDGISENQERAPLVEAIQGLLSDRDRVEAAYGDPAEVSEALQALEEKFCALTSEHPSHTRVTGRTIVYLDSSRDLQVEIGTDVLRALAGPLEIVLLASNWLARRTEEVYEEALSELASDEPTPFMDLVAKVFPTMTSVPRETQPLMVKVVAEFRAKWAELLGPMGDGPVLTFEPDRLLERAAIEFKSRRPSWSAGSTHSPDLILSRTTPGSSDEFVVTLGEIHLANNTLESRLYGEQHPDKADLLAAASADHGNRRIYAIEPKSSPYVTSRVAPPSALLSNDYIYWTWSDDAPSISVPPGTLDARDLSVFRSGDQLLVKGAGMAGPLPLMEMLGEMLSEAVVNCFQPFDHAGHTPRVVIGSFVLSRESWSFLSADCAWASSQSEELRFLHARRWRKANGLPEQVFAKVPNEKKPFAIDFTVLASVDKLAKSIRSTTSDEAVIRFTELLPAETSLVAKDAKGSRFTSELRFVAVQSS